MRGVGSRVDDKGETDGATGASVWEDCSGAISFSRSYQVEVVVFLVVW